MTLRVALLSLALLVLPGAASADVLVSAVPERVPCGAVLKPGVWYQAYSGGPRRATIVVRRGGHTVLRKRIRATETWRYWRVRPRCGARYVVVYRLSGGPVRFPVRVAAR